MLPLQPNKVTGFLESPSDNPACIFSSDKKLKFIELVKRFKVETGKWPDIGTICDQLGVGLRTFQTHISIDRRFKEEWEELLLHGEARMESKLYASNHPISNLAWLRRHFPQRWNPEYKVTTEVSHTFVNELIDKAKAIDGEIVSDANVNVVEGTNSLSTLGMAEKPFSVE